MHSEGEEGMSVTKEAIALDQKLIDHIYHILYKYLGFFYYYIQRLHIIKNYSIFCKVILLYKLVHETVK